MDYKELIDRLKNETYWLGSGQPYSHDIHPAICDDAVVAITNLLARAEAAEARAEKAERERDEYLEAICTHCGDFPCREDDCPWWRGQKEE